MATNAQGFACRNRAVRGSHFCHMHGPRALKLLLDYDDIRRALDRPTRRVAATGGSTCWQDLPDDPEWRMSGATIFQYFFVFGRDEDRRAVRLPIELQIASLLIALDMLPPADDATSEGVALECIAALWDWLQGGELIEPSLVRTGLSEEWLNPSRGVPDSLVRPGVAALLLNAINLHAPGRLGLGGAVCHVLTRLAGDVEPCMFSFWRSQPYTRGVMTRGSVRAAVGRWWSRCRSRLALANPGGTELDVKWPALSALPHGADAEFASLLAECRGLPLREPWRVLGEQESASFAADLHHFLYPPHALAGCVLRAVAVRESPDEIQPDIVNFVLFVLAQPGSPVLAEVTMTEEPPHWPHVEYFTRLADWAAARRMWIGG